jgi:hypothetical protein
MAESPSLSGMVHRFNTYAMSVAAIYTLADESSAASAECSSLAGTRIRNHEGESMVVVNTFLDDSRSIGQRDSVTRSLSARLPNMTGHRAANKGKVDAKVTRELMDLPLYDADGKLAQGGGCTKPVNHDEDITVHQVVTDVKRREIWLKRPNPSVFADWTHIDLNELWG